MAAKDEPKGDPFEEGMRQAFADYKKHDDEAVTAKLRELLPLLLNEELLRLANRKMHRIGGETGVMEGEEKLQLVVDKRIYVELQGKDGAAETDLVAFAGKLDLKAMAKLE